MAVSIRDSHRFLVPLIGNRLLLQVRCSDKCPLLQIREFFGCKGVCKPAGHSERM